MHNLIIDTIFYLIVQFCHDSTMFQRFSWCDVSSLCRFLLLCCTENFTIFITIKFFLLKHSVKGKRYFTCQPKYGGFVRPSQIEVGDFPEDDLGFSDEDDEMWMLLTNLFEHLLDKNIWTLLMSLKFRSQLTEG